MKKGKSITSDPRIESLNCYERGHWCAMCKKEFMFHGNSRSVNGTLKEIKADMKTIVPVEPEYQYD